MGQRVPPAPVGSFQATATGPRFIGSVVDLGHPLLDRYVKFVVGRSQPNL